MNFSGIAVSNVAVGISNGGVLTVQNCVFQGGGLGILNYAFGNSGVTVTASGCTFINNANGAIKQTAQRTSNPPSTATITVSDCTFSNNSLSFPCINEDNEDPTGGAAIFSHHQDVSSSLKGEAYVYVSRCTFVGNSAALGGAIFHDANARPAAALPRRPLANAFGVIGEGGAASAECAELWCRR